VNVVTGGKGLKGQAQRTQEAMKRSRFMEKLQSFLTLHDSWEFLLDYISKNDKASKQLGGPLQEYARDVKAAEDAEAAGIQSRTDMVTAAAERIFGAKKRKLARILAENSRRMSKTGVFVNGQEYALSKNEAYHLWQMYFQPQNLEQDERGNTVLERMGFTAETKAQLEAFMGDKVKAWAEWQMREFYEDEYHRINAVFRDLYSADLPHNPMYAPAPREFTNAKEGDNLLGHEQRRATVFSGSLYTRITNLRDFKVVDGDALLFQHVFEMEHFISHGPLMKKLRATIGAQDTLTAIQHYFPEGAATRVRRFLNAFARGGEEHSAVLGMLQKLRRNFSQAVIASPVTTLKQVSSFAYMGLEMPLPSFTAEVSKVLARPWKAFHEFRALMNESTVLKDRYQSGWERDFRLAMMKSVPNRMGSVKTIMDYARLFTILGDKAAVFLGGVPVYRWNLAKNLKAGMSESEAKAKAMTAFETAIERTQQSGRTSYMGEIQRDAWTSPFTMFMSQPMSILRYTLATLRNVKAGRISKAEAMKQLFVANVLGPALFGWVAAGMIWGGDDDDEDDERFTKMGIPKEIVRQILTSPFQGTVFINPIVDPLTRRIAYGYAIGSASSQFMPWLDTADDFVNAGNNTFKAFEGGAIEPEIALRVLSDLASLGSKMAGVPYEPMKRMATGIRAAATGETEYPVRRAMGYSASAMGERRSSGGGETLLKVRLPRIKTMSERMAERRRRWEQP
jgi:hypothetical protein